MEGVLHRPDGVLHCLLLPSTRSSHLWKHSRPRWRGTVIWNIPGNAIRQSATHRSILLTFSPRANTRIYARVVRMLVAYFSSVLLTNSFAEIFNALASLMTVEIDG